MHVWHDRAEEQVSDLVVPAAGVSGLKFQLDARNYKLMCSTKTNPERTITTRATCIRM